jgi:hypothetical protein
MRISKAKLTPFSDFICPAILLAIAIAYPRWRTGSDHERLTEEAERDTPAIVLLSEQNQLIESAPMIIEYLRMHYLLTDQFGDIFIYERLETN